MRVGIVLFFGCEFTSNFSEKKKEKGVWIYLCLEEHEELGLCIGVGRGSIFLLSRGFGSFFLLFSFFSKSTYISDQGP